MIPFVDLKAQYTSIKEEIDGAIESVLTDTQFILGPHVKEFEEKFSKLQRVPYSVACSNGTAALFLSMKVLGVGKGDEVITVPNTFIATTEMITKTGAKVVFVDVDEKTRLMNPKLLEKAITEKTKAIIPVHLHGQMCDMESIMAIAKKHNLFVIEDAAQAHCAEYAGKRAGEWGDIATFSFYPAKNLGAYGDAGAVITQNKKLADAVRQKRDHGRLLGEKYAHAIEAYSERMDGLQGAILSVKANHIEEWTEARRKNAKKYDELLSGIKEIKTPFADAKSRHVYHIYAIELSSKEERDKLQVYLKSKKIGVGIHYPITLHLQPAYAYLGHKKGDFLVAEKLADTMLSLPMFPELSEVQIVEVCSAIKEFFA